jgi:hypothetical protein
LPSDRDALLERVYSRANAMWWRRRALPLGAAALVLLVGVAVMWPGHGRRDTTRVQLAGPEADADATTTVPALGGDDPTAATTTTTSTTRPKDPNASVSSPIQTTTTTRFGQTTTTAFNHCRNNNGDPSCGEFRWASDPGANAPLQFDVTWSPSQPHAGQVVTFTVHVVDPDATPINSCGDFYAPASATTTTWTPYGSTCAHTMECAANYGPWDVPPKQRGENTFVFKHTFASAGAYDATFSAESMQGAKTSNQCGSPPNPYASGGITHVAVNVS